MAIYDVVNDKKLRYELRLIQLEVSVEVNCMCRGSKKVNGGF